MDPPQPAHDLRFPMLLTDPAQQRMNGVAPLQPGAAALGLGASDRHPFGLINPGFRIQRRQRIQIG